MASDGQGTADTRGYTSPSNLAQEEDEPDAMECNELEPQPPTVLNDKPCHLGATEQHCQTEQANTSESARCDVDLAVGRLALSEEDPRPPAEDTHPGSNGVPDDEQQQDGSGHASGPSPCDAAAQGLAAGTSTAHVPRSFQQQALSDTAASPRPACLPAPAPEHSDDNTSPSDHPMADAELSTSAHAVGTAHPSGLAGSAVDTGHGDDCNNSMTDAAQIGTGKPDSASEMSELPRVSSAIGLEDDASVHALADHSMHHEAATQQGAAIRDSGKPVVKEANDSAPSHDNSPNLGVRKRSLPTAVSRQPAATSNMFTAHTQSEHRPQSDNGRQEQKSSSVSQVPAHGDNPMQAYPQHPVQMQPAASAKHPAEQADHPQTSRQTLTAPPSLPRASQRCVVLAKTHV